MTYMTQMTRYLSRHAYPNSDKSCYTVAIIWGSLLIWFIQECKWVRKMPNLFETPQHVCMINTPERIIGASSVWALRSQKLPIYLPSRFAFNNFDHMQIIIHMHIIYDSFQCDVWRIFFFINSSISVDIAKIWRWGSSWVKQGIR